MDGKTKRYKNGDYRAYKFWTDDQWKGLSEHDKAQWSEYSDEDQAPISKEVIEFTEKNDLETKEPCCKEVNECVELRAKVAELEEKVRELGGNKVSTEDQIKNDPESFPLTDAAGQQVGTTDEPDEETQKQLIKDKLTKLGIPFRANTGLVKLKAKLEDANNSE